MFEVLKESTIRLAENWSVFREFGWTLYDLQRYQKETESKEALDVVNHTLNNKSNELKKRQLRKKLLHQREINNGYKKSRW